MSQKNIFWVALAGNNEIYAGGNANLVFLADEDKPHDLSDSIQIDFGNCYYGPDFSVTRSVIPDLDSLYPPIDSNEHPVPKAILMTHDHPDHLEGIAQTLLRGRKLPPIIASEFALAVLKRRLDDLGFIGHIDTLTVKAYGTYNIAGWKVSPFPVSHSTAECLGFFIEKDGKNFLHLGDFKNDSTVLLGPHTDFNFLKMIEETEGVDAILLDGIFGSHDSSMDDEHIREILRNEFSLNKGKRIIFAFYGGYLEMAANLMAVAAENDYAVIVSGSILEKRLSDLAKVRAPIEEILKNKSFLPGMENIEKLKIYFDGDPELESIDKNKTIVLTDIVMNDPKSFLGRLLLNQERALSELDENDSVYVTGTSIKYSGYTELFKRFANRFQEKGVTFCYKESGRFMDAVGHASWVGISHVINITKPKTVAFIYARKKDLEETFNRSSFFGHINRISPRNGLVFQLVPFRQEPVADWGERWIDVLYEPESKTDMMGRWNYQHHPKPGFRP